MAKGYCWIALMIVLVVLGCAKADPQHEQQLCARVLRAFVPCIMYLSGRTSAAHPPAACCASIKALNQQAKSLKYGPKRFCQCIEDFTDVMKIGMTAARIQQLPKKCCLQLSFPISISLDCSKVR